MPLFNLSFRKAIHGARGANSPVLFWAKRSAVWEDANLVRGLTLLLAEIRDLGYDFFSSKNKE